MMCESCLLLRSCSSGDMMCESCCCYACAPPSAMPLRARIHCHPFLTTTAATSSSKATPTRFSVCGTSVTCHVTVSHINASHCMTCHIISSHVTLLRHMSHHLQLRLFRLLFVEEGARLQEMARDTMPHNCVVVIMYYALCIKCSLKHA